MDIETLKNKANKTFEVLVAKSFNSFDRPDEVIESINELHSKQESRAKLLIYDIECVTDNLNSYIKSKHTLIELISSSVNQNDLSYVQAKRFYENGNKIINKVTDIIDDISETLLEPLKIHLGSIDELKITKDKLNNYFQVKKFYEKKLAEVSRLDSSSEYTDISIKLEKKKEKLLFYQSKFFEDASVNEEIFKTLLERYEKIFKSSLSEFYKSLSEE